MVVTYHFCEKIQDPGGISPPSGPRQGRVVPHLALAMGAPISPVPRVTCADLNGGPGGAPLVERDADPFFPAPDDVARPADLVGLNDQREAVGNEKRGEDFERGPGCREVANRAVEGAAAERDRPGFQDAMARGDSMLIIHGTPEAAFELRNSEIIVKSKCRPSG
jgi:hypothetical protein